MIQNIVANRVLSVLLSNSNYSYTHRLIIDLDVYKYILFEKILKFKKLYQNNIEK